VVRLHNPQRFLTKPRIHRRYPNLKQRLPDHNTGRSTHTAKYRPWEVIWYSAFQDKYKALEFEKYLKPHSGRAFAKKRF
jgi:putative endonuclease